ncbi:poly(A)-specific ribonuclease PARN isoform X2 [Tanacetum coccineum]
MKPLCRGVPFIHQGNPSRLYTRCERQKSFVAHPHNFYIFPRQEVGGGDTSYEFLCQTSSIDFLAKYQFDFNVCIKEGISYISRVHEDEARLQLHSTHEDALTESQCTAKEIKDVSLVRMADILFVERMRNKISTWHDDLLKIGNGGSGRTSEDSTDSLNQFQTIFFKMRPAIKLNGYTSRQLRLIKSVVEKSFKDLAYIRVNDGSCFQQMIVYTDSGRDLELLMKEVKGNILKEAEMKIGAAIGFRHVIDLLSSEQKLIVGHNCFLDIAHVCKKFVGPLPSKLEEFITLAHKSFPYIIDTKILLNANHILQLKMKKSSTSLAKAFAIMCPHIASGVGGSGLASSVAVVVQVDDMISSNWNSGAKHEAFMTGCIFAQSCNHLRVGFSSDSTLMNEDKLKSYINLLYLSWSNGDIVDIKTGTTTTESLAFNSFKSLQKVIFPNIIFSNPELVSECMELISQIEKKKNDAVYVLHPLSELLEVGSTRIACYEVYKEICASPISKVLFADQAEAVGVNLNKLLKSKAHENGSFTNLNSPIDAKTSESKQPIKSSPGGSSYPSREMLDIVSC